MIINPPETGTWIKSLGDVFLGLNKAAIVRRIIGVISPLPNYTAATRLHGLSWEQFLKFYADESARNGLRCAWLAMADEHVAPDYWAEYLPFRPGMVARLRPVENDPIIAFAVHISAFAGYELDQLMGSHILECIDRLTRMSQRVFSGVNGPLTDIQIKEVGSILNSSRYAQQLLENLRAQMLTPASVAPLPHPIKQLLTCDMGSFSERRITTHQLTLTCTWSDAVVYCQSAVRSMVEQIIQNLIPAIAAQSRIELFDQTSSDPHTVQVTIRYYSQHPDLSVTERVTPIPLADPPRHQGRRTIEHLVSMAQAHLQPVHGRAWAESCPDDPAASQIILILPRWQGAIPEKMD